MDSKTIEQYDKQTDIYLCDWMAHTPAALRELIDRWFIKHGASILDVGSGSGRDVKWLAERGFEASGVDASRGLIAAASSRYQHLSFRLDPLPDLANTPDESFDYVLCSAVLMHLPAQEISLATKNIFRILKSGGRAILSIRPSREQTEREADGRLYTQISVGDLVALAEAAGAVLLHKQTSHSEKADRIWHTVVAEKRH